MKTNSSGLRPRLTRQMSAAFGTLMLILTSLSAHAGDVAPLKSLNGLSVALIDGQITLNCKMKTPELCVSRKDIRISTQTSEYMKQTIANMAPGLARQAKWKADIQALNEENAKLKGTGEEFKIAENTERLAKLAADSHPDYYALHHTPFLWDNSPLKFGASRYAGGYDPDYRDSYATTTFNHVLNAQLRTYSRNFSRFVNIAGAQMSIWHDLFVTYNPDMQMSFILTVSANTDPGTNESHRYSNEEMIVRCEERRIYNTFVGVKTTLSERNLYCKLPEDMGYLRFLITEKL